VWLFVVLRQLRKFHLGFKSLNNMKKESSDRRDFIKQVTGAAAAVAAVPVLMESANAQSRGVTVVGGTAPTPPPQSARVGLELNGAFAGWLDSAEGGACVSEVVTEKVGADHIAKKHISTVKYEGISVSCGAGMSNTLYSWIQAMLNNQPSPQSGAIVYCDYNYQELSRLDFRNALISEFGMPALDAASKDAAKMTLKFKPEITRLSLSGSGKPVGTSAPTQKQWLPANFRLKIDGLEEACTKVNKIEALTIKQKVAENPVGEQRDYEKEPASLEIPNLALQLPPAPSQGFLNWHDECAMKGNCGEDQEKGGTLQYLSPDNQEALFTLTFRNLGVFKVAPDKVEAGSEGIRRVKAEMYCEEIKFDYKASWA